MIPAVGEHDCVGHESAQENLDVTLIEDRQRRWLGSRHLALAILGALVVN